MTQNCTFSEILGAFFEIYDPRRRPHLFKLFHGMKNLLKSELFESKYRTGNKFTFSLLAKPPTKFFK